MAHDYTDNGRPRSFRPLNGLGGRAAASALRPLTGAMGAAVGAGVSLERRAVDRVLDSGELERIVVTALDSAHVQAVVRRALESDGAARLLDALFDSGLIDRFLLRLLESERLWRMIDEIAASPAVTAAISQQGLSFAGEVGDEVRTRSRKADDLLERAARRLIHRHPPAVAPEPKTRPR